MNQSLFNAVFADGDAKAIADEIKFRSGYHVFEGALSNHALSAIEKEVPMDSIRVNNNDLGFVHAHWTKYFSHTLAMSKACYDIITSEQVINICRNYFDRPFKVCNQRIYETHTKAHLPWHTDNNLQVGNKYKGKHQIPGLMFLFYLSDVSETNPFQLIPQSHKWISEKEDRFFTDRFIEENHADEVLTVKAPKGTLIMCSTRVVHRAKPFNQPGFKRLTFLFQVDEVSDEHVGHGERLLVNPSFVNNTSAEMLTYLGFGVPCSYPAFPETSVSTLLPLDIYALQKSILPKAVKGIALSLAKTLIPGSVVNNLRRFVKAS
jgi:ectoine hydroxylase-related dioxygenase (phytanoyl-CoA dioxygenase family)